MKKLIVLAFAAMLLTACGGDSEVSGKAESKKTEDGSYVTAEVTKKGDKITKISINEYDTSKKKMKKELGSDYGMKAQSGIGKEWDEQIKYLETYLKDNGIDSVKIDEATGKATNDDVLSGCTIAVSKYVETAKEAADSAK